MEIIFITKSLISSGKLGCQLESLFLASSTFKVVLSSNVYGGIPSDEEQLVSELNSSGVHVKFLSGFQYVHSKVFIINNCTVILGSINPTYYGIHKDHGVDLDIHKFIYC